MPTRIVAWLAYEPVRAYLYGVGIAVLLLLNGYALLADDKVALWGNLLAFLLVPAVEKARSRVVPQFPRSTSTSKEI